MAMAAIVVRCGSIEMWAAAGAKSAATSTGKQRTTGRAVRWRCRRMAPWWPSGHAENDGNGDTSGQVRLYRNVGGSWSQIGSDIDGEAAGDRSGTSVALSADGSVVAIGAPDNDGNGNNSGQVRLYRNVGGSWSQIGSDIDGEAAVDYSGSSVALSADGSVVAIGAPYNDGNGNFSGQVRLYQTGLAIVEGDALLSLAGISVTDVDGDLASTELSVNHGTLTVALAGASSITAGANASHSLTLSGSEADVNATLASLIYQAEPDYTGADTLTIVSTDSAGASDADTVAIAVKGVNRCSQPLLLRLGGHQLR